MEYKPYLWMDEDEPNHHVLDYLQIRAQIEWETSRNSHKSVRPPIAPGVTKIWRKADGSLVVEKY